MNLTRFQTASVTSVFFLPQRKRSHTLSAFIADDKDDENSDYLHHSVIPLPFTSPDVTQHAQYQGTAKPDITTETDFSLLNNAQLHCISPSPALSDHVQSAALQLWEITVKV